MWFFQEWNHLPSSLSLERWGQPQQLKPRSNHRVCPTTDIHRGACFSQSCGPLQKVHQGVCAHTTAPQGVPCWGRGQQEVRGVSLTEDTIKAFKALKQTCMTAPILVSFDYTKPFLLETDVSKDGLGWCCHRNKHTGGTTPLPMPAEPCCHTRKTITQPNLSFWH